MPEVHWTENRSDNMKIEKQNFGKNVKIGDEILDLSKRE